MGVGLAGDEFLFYLDVLCYRFLAIIKALYLIQLAVDFFIGLVHNFFKAKELVILLFFVFLVIDLEALEVHF